MTKMKTVVLSLFAALAFALPAFGQTVLTMTTLSAALPGAVSSVTGSGAPGVLTVASATGISAPTPNTGFIASAATSAAQTLLYVDKELMEVRAVSGTTITVVRGVGSTANTSHISGALVFVIPTANNPWMNAQLGAQPQSIPAGSCTRANELYLPRINFQSGTISDCLGGQWVNGDAGQTTRTVNGQLQFPPIGNVAYTSAGTSTTKATNTMYCTEIDLPYSKYLTGLAMLNGASTGTDKWILALYDSGGNLLANSAVAGTVASGNSTFQKQAFVTPFYAVGPAQYFACAQGDSGTTATINLLVTGTADTYYTKKFASQTFGTLAAIATPTTFTTASGGYWFLY